MLRQCLLEYESQRRLTSGRLYEPPGGNLVDSLPPASSPKVFQYFEFSLAPVVRFSMLDFVTHQWGVTFRFLLPQPQAITFEAIPEWGLTLFDS